MNTIFELEVLKLDKLLIHEAEDATEEGLEESEESFGHDRK